MGAPTTACFYCKAAAPDGYRAWGKTFCRACVTTVTAAADHHATKRHRARRNVANRQQLERQHDPI